METFQRKIIEFNRKKGGLGLDVLESRCTSTFFEEDFVRPARSDFNYQRLYLCRYFFSFQVRQIYDHLFTLSDPSVSICCQSISILSTSGRA